MTQLKQYKDMLNEKVKYIPLFGGKFIIVDEEDYPVLSRLSWHYSGVNSFPNACYTSKSDDPKKKGTVHNIPISRFLIVNKNGLRPITINKNYLDCRKENIRLTSSHSLKKQNSRKIIFKNEVKTFSKYKGVSINARCNTFRYRAYINPRIRDGVKVEVRKQIHLGSFKTEDEAAIAYNKKAVELYGEFAYQNLIQD